MRAFVTGGSGFIGSNLIKRLIAEEWSVVCLTRKSNDLGLKHRRLRVVQGNLLDKKTFERYLSKVDVIFNLAAGLPHHKLSDQAYWDINVGGTQNLLEVSKKYKLKRFVHVSTVGIYGPTDRKGVTESSPLSLTDSYSKTKAEAEQVLKEYAQKYKMPFTIIRPTIGFGPCDTRPGFLNLFRLIKKQRFILIGNGNNYFHTIYVENLIDALLLAAVEKKAIGEDFIIGDDPCPTMREVVSKIAQVEKKKLPNFYLPVPVATLVAKCGDFGEVFGFKIPLTTQRIKFITQDRRYNISKAREVLGYKPHFNLEQAVERTYGWYLKNGYFD